LDLKQIQGLNVIQESYLPEMEQSPCKIVA